MNDSFLHIAFYQRSHNVICLLLSSCCASAVNCDPFALLLPNVSMHCMITYVFSY